MKKFVIWFLLPLLTFSACVNEEEFPDTSQGNFEALWKIIDEHYCFFDYKQHEYGLDWNAIYNIYKVRAREEANKYQLFEVLTDMLSELRDGHVNLYSSFDNGRYWRWHEDYPTNFSDTLQRKYLDTDYRIASGMRYRILDDNIGYAYYGSFTSPVSDSGLNEIMHYFAFCNGLIIDIRENGGGDLTNAQRLAGRFTNEKILVGYMCHKTGKGHDDFSEPRAEYIEPSQSIRWQKPVVVLVNRSCYSAANIFVRNMKEMPLVTIMGDQTGGGSGMPFSSELPIGWSVRFSASPSFDARMHHIEFGIKPDVEASLDEALAADGKDSMIEAARALLAD